MAFNLTQIHVEETTDVLRTARVVYEISRELIANGWVVKSSGTGNGGAAADSDQWGANDTAYWVDYTDALEEGAWIVLQAPSGNYELQLGIPDSTAYEDYGISYSISPGGFDSHTTGSATAVPTTTSSDRVFISGHTSTEYGSTYSDTQIKLISTSDTDQLVHIWTGDHNDDGNYDTFYVMPTQVSDRGDQGIFFAARLKDSYTSDTFPYAFGAACRVAPTDLTTNTTYFSFASTTQIRVVPITVVATDIDATMVMWAPDNEYGFFQRTNSRADIGGTWPEEGIHIISWNASEYYHRGQLPLLKYCINEEMPVFTLNQDRDRVFIKGFSLPWISTMEQA